MHVEIGTEAAKFLFGEYINGIFVAVYRSTLAPSQYRVQQIWPLLKMKNIDPVIGYKKSKEVFSKYVLEFNFGPITGPVFFI